MSWNSQLAHDENIKWQLEFSGYLGGDSDTAARETKDNYVLAPSEFFQDSCK